MSEPILTGQVAVVTGAAGGLGLAIARRLAEAGAAVILADRHAPAVHAAAAGLRDVGLTAHAAALDVRDPAQSRALVEGAVAEQGRLDMWINAAGLWYEAPAEILPQAWWDESLAVITSGAFFCAQAAAGHMLAQRRGVIVNIASVEGRQPVEGHVAYSVAQAGLIMLTQALGVEWARSGVRVVGVAPGVVAGDWLNQDEAGATGANATGAGTAMAAVYRRRTPLRRIGAPEEVAEAVLYLVSPEAAYIVAETLPVDGGWRAYQLF
jgi:NAD(P)-dependent dehydrogenase (short-subunit alcohol dehydrogenase family)